MRIAILFSVVIIALSSPLLADRKVYREGFDGYTGCEDTYMIEYRVESNYGDAIYIECQSEDGREGGSRMKPLIRFNHLGLQGHTVTACTLQLYCYFAHGENQRIQLHEALRDWKEYQVTCPQYGNGLPWTDFACGCNDEDATVAFVSAIVDSGGAGWKSLPVPASVVQRWVDAPGDTNNGLLILAPEDEPGVIKDRSFRSSDMFASSLRPALIIHYNSSAPCETSLQPMIVDITDVPDDAGGFVNLNWKRSSHDEGGSEPLVKRYRIWRKRMVAIPPMPPLGLGREGREAQISNGNVSEEGPIWELVGKVKAGGDCYYSCQVPTHCDSGAAGTCRTTFYVSAHTGTIGECFDSPLASGYSVDNSGLGSNALEEAGDDQDQIDDLIEISTKLEIPRPNPSTDGCTFAFEIARAGPVLLRMYDATGRLVATLADDYRVAGPHSVRWNHRTDAESEAAPGIYFAILEASTETHIRKLVILK
jgi:hypothetical protein